MNCPICSSRCFDTTNGCQSCSYRPTEIEIARDEARLLAIVRENRNRTKAAVEWGGIDWPKEPKDL